MKRARRGEEGGGGGYLQSICLAGIELEGTGHMMQQLRVTSVQMTAKVTPAHI